MSAFLVSDKTMQRAVEAVLIAESSEWSRVPPIEAPVVTKLGNELFALNQSALASRYGDNDEPPVFVGKTFDPPGVSEIGVMNVQHLKSLQCLIYQCSEGDVPETTDLYKRLKAAEAALAIRIVQNSAPYDKAKWGE